MNQCGHILLYRQHGLLAKLIGWQTRSVFSHAAILFPDGQTIIESAPFVGVRRRRFNNTDAADAIAFAVDGMSAAQWDQVIEFCVAELSCPYDWRSVFRFVTRRKAGSRNRWFCSELVFAACEHAGVRLLARTHSWAVAPGHLAWSPLLIERKAAAPKAFGVKQPEGACAPQAHSIPAPATN